MNKQEITTVIENYLLYKVNIEIMQRRIKEGKLPLAKNQIEELAISISAIQEQSMEKKHIPFSERIGYSSTDKCECKITSKTGQWITNGICNDCGLPVKSKVISTSPSPEIEKTIDDLLPDEYIQELKGRHAKALLRTVELEKEINDRKDCEKSLTEWNEKLAQENQKYREALQEIGGDIDRTHAFYVNEAVITKILSALQEQAGEGKDIQAKLITCPECEHTWTIGVFLNYDRPTKI